MPVCELTPVYTRPFHQTELYQNMPHCHNDDIITDQSTRFEFGPHIREAIVLNTYRRVPPRHIYIITLNIFYSKYAYSSRRCVYLEQYISFVYRPKSY